MFGEVVGCRVFVFYVQPVIAVVGVIVVAVITHCGGRRTVRLLVKVWLNDEEGAEYRDTGLT
jgi:amino acid permease